MDEVLQSARTGSGTPLVVRGDIGTGKSTLLEYARDRAREHRLPVLQCRGLESESHLAFSGLGDLLRPLNRLVGRLPSGQAHVLEGVLEARRTAEDNPLALGLATLGVLTLAASGGPLLITVDDLHWLDRPSGAALRFAVRRLPPIGIAAVLTDRTVGADDAGPQSFGLPTMTIRGLAPRFGMELVRRAVGVPVSDAVARHLTAVTGGNPRALVEISARLTPDELSGRRPIDRLPEGLAICAELGRRLESLPATTRLGLLVIAAADTADPGQLHETLIEIGLTPSCLAAAEHARLLAVDAAGIEFRDPLIRTVLLQDAGADLRPVHDVLATVAARRGEPERQAWHRAAALDAPDDAVAQALAATWPAARALGGPAMAARALERAAVISTASDRRCGFLLAAAGHAMNAGAFAWSRDLVERSGDEAADPGHRVEVTVMRAALNQVCGSAWTAQHQLRDLGRFVAGHDAERGAALHAGAALAAIQAGRIVEAGSAASEAVALVADPAPTTTGLLCAAAHAVVAGYAGIAVPDPDPALLVLESGTRHRLPQWPNVLPFALAVVAARGPDGLARRVLDDLVRECRQDADLGRLPVFLTQQAELLIQEGRWGEGYVQTLDALQLAEETGQHSSVTHALTVLARVEAARGEADTCAAHLQEAADLAARADDGLVRFPREAVRGLMHLTMGDTHRAVLVLERLMRDQDRAGLHEPAMFAWTADLLEAQVKEGHGDRAVATLELFDTGAGPSTWSRAMAARCRGLLAAEADYESAFESALDLLGPSLPFERARTQLCFGERLRRSRRRSAAIRRLDAAMDAFTRLGASPWAERARAEIAVAVGERRPADAADTRSLTPQEQKVARLVAGGSSNREVAASLYLSEKTIEAHLTRIYRSLRVRSRAQLAAVMRDSGVQT